MNLLKKEVMNNAYRRSYSAVRVRSYIKTLAQYYFN